MLAFLHGQSRTLLRERLSQMLRIDPHLARDLHKPRLGDRV